MRAPAYGPDDAPAAFRETLRSYLRRPEESLARFGLKFHVSPRGPRSCSVFRVAYTTHIDDVLSCGEADILWKAAKYSAGRFGVLAAQEQSFAHAGMELFRTNDSSEQSTPGSFTDALKPIPTSPQLRSAENSGPSRAFRARERAPSRAFARFARRVFSARSRASGLVDQAIKQKLLPPRVARSSFICPLFFPFFFPVFFPFFSLSSESLAL